MKVYETIPDKFVIIEEDTSIKVLGTAIGVCIGKYNDELTMYWLTKEEGVYEKDLVDEKTVSMINLAFSLMKKQSPESNTVSLMDDIGFYSIQFQKGYLLFHGKTWYEDTWNAVMCDYETFQKYRKKAENNFEDPAKKPFMFNFKNSEMQVRLEPLYTSTKTWGEFLQKLVEIYGEEKYSMIHDWYREAIYCIFDGMEINQNWKIDISKIQHVEYVIHWYDSVIPSYNRLEPFSWSP